MIQHPSLVVNFLVVIGESFWVFSYSAQLIRLHRTRNTKGLAPVTQTLNTAGTVAWACYFGVNHLWFPLVTNLIAFIVCSAILGYTLSNRKKFIKGIVAIAVIAPVTSYLLIRNPSVGGWIGMSYNWIAGTPWLFRVVSRKKVSGISEHGIYFAFGAMLCVFIYAAIINSLPLMAGCLQGFLYELVVVRFYYKYRRSD